MNYVVNEIVFFLIFELTIKRWKSHHPVDKWPQKAALFLIRPYQLAQAEYSNLLINIGVSARIMCSHTFSNSCAHPRHPVRRIAITQIARTACIPAVPPRVPQRYKAQSLTTRVYTFFFPPSLYTDPEITAPFWIFSLTPRVPQIVVFAHDRFHRLLLSNNYFYQYSSLICFMTSYGITDTLNLFETFCPYVHTLLSLSDATVAGTGKREDGGVVLRG
jgi:hypothetical protein